MNDRISHAKIAALTDEQASAMPEGYFDDNGMAPDGCIYYCYAADAPDGARIISGYEVDGYTGAYNDKHDHYCGWSSRGYALTADADVAEGIAAEEDIAQAEEEIAAAEKAVSVESGSYRVAILSCNAKPLVDPFHRDTRGRTTTTLWINYREQTCGLRQDWKDYSTTSDEWHSLVATIGIDPAEDAELDPQAVLKYLQSDDGQSLLNRICDGHTIAWNGSNLVGTKSDDAEEALQEIASTIAGLTDDWSSSFCSEIMDHLTAEELGITEDMGRDEICALAANLEAQLRSSHIALLDDITVYLADRSKALSND